MTSGADLDADADEWATPSAEDWKRAGDACLEREDYPGAIESYFTALQLEPEHPACRYNLALVHLELDQYEEAKALLRGVLASRPNDPEALNTLGWSLLWNDEPAEAIKTFRRALMAQPKFAAAQVGLGWAHLAEAPPAVGRAADAFAKAIALETDDPEAYYGLATVCELRDEPIQAIPLLESVLRLWPQDGRAHESLARIYEAAGDWQQAAHHLMQLAHDDRENPELMRRLATLFASHEAHDRAAVFWRRYQKLVPKDTTAAAGLGESLMAADRAEEAIDALREVVAADPDSAHGLAQLGHAYFYARRFGQALEAYLLASRREPTNPFHFYNMGNAYLEHDEPDPAVSAFQTALQFDPDLFDARVGLGWACFAQGRLEAARETFELALRQRPEDVGALDGLGSTLWREGLSELAVEAFERARRADAEQGGLIFKLGMIYEELGRLEDARRMFRTLVEGTYAEDRAAEALARLEQRMA